MSRWLPKSATSQMHRMVDSIQELDQLLADHPESAHVQSSQDAFDSAIYAELLRGHISDESIITLLAPVMQYFTGNQISRIVSYISGNEANLSAQDRQDLTAVFGAFSAITTDLEKLYAVDVIRRVFVDKAGYDFDILSPDEDLSLNLTLQEGDDWSGYILCARLDSDGSLLSSGTTQGFPQDTNPVQTVDCGDIDLPVNKLHRIVIALEEDDGGGQTTGERVRVVGQYYLVVQDIVLAKNPTPRLTTTQTAPYTTTPIEFVILWSEPVVGFELPDIALTNASASSLKKITETKYTVQIFPTTFGQVTVTIPAGKVNDANGNGNNGADIFSFLYDLAPTPVITSPLSSPTDTTPIPIQVTFGEVVTGFTEPDIDVTGGTISAFTDEGGGVYSFNITPDSLNEDITVDIAAGVATDAEGNDNKAATQFAISFVDQLPTPTISSAESGSTNTSPIPITISWNEDVTGFTAGDIQLTNATLQNFIEVSQSQHTAELVPDGQGEITVNINASVATDDSGNPNEAAAEFSIVYDTSSPVPAIASTASNPTASAPIPITVLFGEDVQNFDQGDVQVTGATLTNFTQVSPSQYSFNLTPTSDPVTITVDIAAGVCSDLAGNPNLSANQLDITYDGQAPTVSLSTGASDPTNTSPIPVTAQFSEDVEGFTSGDIVASGGTISNFVQVAADQYTFDITPDTDPAAITVDIPAAVCQDITGNDNEAATQLSIGYDGTAPTVGDPALSTANQTDTSVDIVFAKATDNGPDTDLIYRLYRAPDETDLSTLAEIDGSGTEVDSGTDVAQLSDSGLTPDTYEYNVTVEDLAGNRSLYTQLNAVLIEPTVSSVTINESFTYQDLADNTIQLSAEIIAENVGDLSLNWFSDNEQIATVDANGLVTFIATGPVTITVESNFDPTKQDTITFTIYEFSAPSEEISFTTAAA